MPQRVGARNLQRENHYLPQCYQRGFADDFGRVWIKERGKSEAEHRRTRSIGRRRNFYIRKVNGVEDDKIEQYFGKSIEDGFGLVSQRIKNEGHSVTLSGTEVGFVARFVAAQAVRTIAHKHCVEEQAGGPIDRQTYLNVMCRQMLTIATAWSENLPSVQFLTSLPFVTHRFITGDNPVVVLTVTNGAISAHPMTAPTIGITNLTDILNSTKSRFFVTLSPYMAVTIGSGPPNRQQGRATSLDPIVVLRANALIRNQCQFFTIARDRDSL
jgi:uncharacterized protein DUF4238